MIENGKNPKHRLSHLKLFKDIALDWGCRKTNSIKWDN
jgi:hypothetical protein